MEQTDGYCKIYKNVYDKIDFIMSKYEHILNPNVNNLTYRLLMDNHDIKHAYALSFSITLALYANMI